MKTLFTLIGGLLAALAGWAAPPTITTFTPASAAPGMTLTITGTNFTGVSAVSIGGVAATSYTVVSATQITAVVPATASGSVQVTTAEGTATRAGFIYVPTSGIITDFRGFWSTTAAAPNTTVPDSSHQLLAFTHNGITYSTGVNDAVLTNQGVAFTPGVFRALPVAGITGTTSAGATYLALARKVDGSAATGNTPAVSSFSVRSVLTDGVHGLDLGTGVTNLPATAVLTFQVFNINAARIADSEPDIILTQIAQPVTGNDVYSFIDAAGTIVGNSFTQDMTLLPRFGSYDLDLFNLTPNTPYNRATAYSINTANTNREIRLIGLRLSDFGITAGNVG
ncbi:MAG TPA: IPT/TIG domain-containing protein, partial [Chitinophagaceae bacterium]|nr:IPT/TIG domain-containing protein [Chitinophagaceae bacterium]